MKVSVCIPTYNSALYIASCIESVLAQRDVDLEIVISDNASTDDTWAIIQSFSDSRIRSFRAERNLGMAANFNRAVDAASGGYIKLLCSDDLLEPNALKLQAEFLDQHSDLPIVSCARHLIDAKGERFGTVRWFDNVVKLDAPNLKVVSLIYGNVVGEPSAVLFRREGLLQTGPFRKEYGILIDLDMWLRLSRLGGLGYLPLPLCCVRRHAVSMTNQLREAGEAQEAVSSLTGDLLRELQAGPLVRRIGLGKIAGSHLRHAYYGLQCGHIKWPTAALLKAFRIDPGFAGLFLHVALFRSGLLGIKIGSDGKAALFVSSTLRCQPGLT